MCGYTRDAIARVFSLPDGDLLHVLKCVPDGARVGFYGGQVTTGNPRTKAIPLNMCQYNLWWPLPLCIFVVHACHAWTFFYPLDFHFYKENPLLSSGPSGHQQQSDCHSGQPGWFIKCFLLTKFSMPSISIVFHWPSSQCDFSFLQQEVGEGDVVSVWEKTTGDLLYQVLATIFLIHL